MGDKKNLLFMAYGGGHVNMIVPLIQAFRQQPKYRIHVVGLTTAGPVLQRAGIPYFGFRDLVEEEDAPALEWGRRLAPDSRNPAVPYEETIAYLGLSYADLEKKYGLEKAAQLYQDQGRRSFLPTTVMERLFAKIKPDLLVATNSPRAEQAGILTAGKRGVPAVCVIDSFTLIEVKWMREPGYANKICVWLDWIKEFLVESGRAPEDIVVTGNPAYDYLADKDLEEKGKQVRAQKGWGTDKVILWASQAQPETHPITGEPGDPDLSRKVDHEFFKLIEKHPDWRLVIRLHPSENFQYDRLPDRVEFSPLSEDLPSLLKAVDVVVSLTSTVGLQGVLLGIPYVILNISVYSQDAPFSKLGLAYGVDRLEDLESGLVQVLNEGWQPTVPLPEIGRATQNVVQVIENQLAQINRPLPG